MCGVWCVLWKSSFFGVCAFRVRAFVGLFFLEVEFWGVCVVCVRSGAGFSSPTTLIIIIIIILDMFLELFFCDFCLILECQALCERGGARRGWCGGVCCSALCKRCGPWSCHPLAWLGRRRRRRRRCGAAGFGWGWRWVFFCLPCRRCELWCRLKCPSSSRSSSPSASLSSPT